MPQTPLERVISLIPNLKPIPGRTGSLKGPCPGHGGQDDNLSVNEASPGGKVLMKCWSHDCSVETIIGAVGGRIADLMPSSPDRSHSRSVEDKGRIVSAYIYTDESGELQYRIQRKEFDCKPKTFLQSRPDGRGGWQYKMGDVRRVPYHLPALVQAINNDSLILVVEGEKCVESAERIGFTSTCTDGGEGSATKRWPVVAPLFKGARVCILPDNDAAGESFAASAANALKPFAASIHVLRLPEQSEKGDIADWVGNGGTHDDLAAMLAETPTWLDWEASNKPPEDSSNGKAGGLAAMSKRAEERRKRCEESAGKTLSSGGLPPIETNNRFLRDKTADAYRYMREANSPSPKVFVRNGQLVRVDKDEDDRPTITALDVPRLRQVIDTCANFVSTSEDRGTVPVSPPRDIVENLLAQPSFPEMPPLTAIVTSPVVGPNGKIIASPGYIPSAALYYNEQRNFTLPDTTPTPESVSKAKSLILDSLLVGFPFVDEASRAHAVALLLLPFVRPLIMGNTPMHLVDAPTAGTGKTLLVDAVTGVFDPNGAKKSAAPEPSRNSDTGEEWRKRLIPLLVSGNAFVFVDNIRGKLQSSALELVLTCNGMYEDRPLGRNDAMVSVAVRCVFVGTANNIEVGGDMPRRVIWIRIDSGREQPEEIDGWKIPNLREWVSDNRPELVAATLTLVRAWIEAGSPRWTGKALGSFESWSLIIGGILETVGIPGFLDNRKEMTRRLDPEKQKWADFFNEWHEKHGDALVMTADLIDIACRAEIVYDSERSGRSSLGRMLRQKKDSIHAGKRLQDTGKKHRDGGAMYRLLLANQPADLFDEVESAELAEDAELERDKRIEVWQSEDSYICSDLPDYIEANRQSHASPASSALLDEGEEDF